MRTKILRFSRGYGPIIGAWAVMRDVLVSFEAYILINFSMNFITIGAMARSQGAVKWGAVAFASLFGALYALAMQLDAFWVLRSWPCRVALSFTLVASTIRIRGPWMLSRAVMVLVCATSFLAGVQMLAFRLTGGVSALSLLVGALCGGALLIAVVDARAQRVTQWEAQICLKSGRKCARFCALIDTGNRLREPVSGLPVLIVEQRLLEGVLPEGFDAAYAAERLPPGFRLAAYGGLGARGKLCCFRPDEVLVSYGEGWMSAPDIWVGVYPGQMPGRVRALAPGVIGTICAPGGRVRRTQKNQRFGRINSWLIRRSR